ncbi:CD99 antigen-like isoform X1 [Lates japonicus]
MEFGLRMVFLLLLLTGTVTVKGSDMSDGLNDNDPHHAAAVDRPKRWSGFSVFDSLRGKGSKPTKPTGGDGLGLNLADAVDLKPSTAPAENGFGFNLEDALHPAVKPTDNSSGGDCQGNVVKKLSTIIENQNQQLRLLLQLMAQSVNQRTIG